MKNSNADKMPSNMLIIDRFCGRELYPIVQARWNLKYSSSLEMMDFCISIYAGIGTQLSEDTVGHRVKPSWEVNVIESTLTQESLVAGAIFEVPEGYDESKDGHITQFYYFSYNTSDANRVEILAVDGNRLHLRVNGEMEDFNYYDGSKPPNKIYAEMWFDKDAEIGRSMA